MPRTYKTKRDRAQAARKENLATAIGVVQTKELTVAQASRRYGVPYTSLRDHVKGISKKIGAGCPTVLIRAEEQEIVVTFQVSNMHGLWIVNVNSRPRSKTTTKMANNFTRYMYLIHMTHCPVHNPGHFQHTLLLFDYRVTTNRWKMLHYM